MNFFGLLPLFLVACNGKHEQDDWIDPTDMLNYDAAGGRMKHHKPYHTEKTDNADGQNQGNCQSDRFDCKTDRNNWKQEDSIDVFSEKEQNSMERMCQESMELVDSLKKENEELKLKEGISQSSCNPVFRRFLYRILNEAQILGLPDESQPEVHYDVELVLTKPMVAEFRRFLDDSDWNAGPLDEALGGTLVRFKHHREGEWSWKFEDYVGTDPFTAFMITLSLLCIVMVVSTELWSKIGWLTQIKRLLALSFLVSIVWNWMYLYRDAFAERQAKLTKIGDVDACAKKMTLSESFIAWWKSSSSFQNDPCEEYFKALLVNPIFMVPPTKAFAVTFTNFITEPLKHIGIGLGEFFHGLLSEMPLFYQPIVLIIIALLLLVFCYGFGTNFYRMNPLRRHDDGERGRLPSPNQRREGCDHFIEGRDGHHHNPQPIQPGHDEGHRDVVARGPEVLHALDCVDINNGQQDVKNQPQRAQVAPEKKNHDQDTKDKLSEQLQSKDVPLDQRHSSQQPAKELLQDSLLGSQDHWEESLKDSKPFDKISPVHPDLSGSHSEVKENLLLKVETLVDTSQITEELRKESAEKENGQQHMKKDEQKVLLENIPVDTVTPAEHIGVLDTTIHPVISHLSDPDLKEEDIYTDPGNSQLKDFK